MERNEIELENFIRKVHNYEYKDEGRFRNDLFEALGISDNPKASLLYSIAYDQGHSAGLTEILNVALGLIDLIT